MTVPALWDDRAKLLMREAAVEVGGRGIGAGLDVNSPRSLGRQGQSTDQCDCSGRWEGRVWLFMTVLALWDDRAKLLMREAAMEVGGRGIRAGLVVNSPAL